MFRSNYVTASTRPSRFYKLKLSDQYLDNHFLPSNLNKTSDLRFGKRFCAFVDVQLFRFCISNTEHKLQSYVIAVGYDSRQTHGKIYPLNKMRQKPPDNMFMDFSLHVNRCIAFALSCYEHAKLRKHSTL